MAGNEVNLLSKTLYVGNLPWATTDKDLAEFFSDSTEVIASRVITDRATGRSKGFGFIEIPEENVEKVISNMNGRELGGREIIVNEAKPLNTEH
jgi:RNA recognition motif-containing protein